VKYFVGMAGLFLAAITGFGFLNEDNTHITVKKTNAILQYTCLPCGIACDNTIYPQAGKCGQCNMQLVDKKTVRFNSIEPADLCNFISTKGKKNVILLDVRTGREFKGEAEVNYGRLDGAINIPVQELESRIAELSKYKNQEIIVYCSHSHRSPQASYLLNQQGFNTVSNMNYGMSEWKTKVKPNNCNNTLFVNQP
jgi:rhodanese-related sulfurtransferase